MCGIALSGRVGLDRVAIPAAPPEMPDAPMKVRKSTSEIEVEVLRVLRKLKLDGRISEGDFLAVETQLPLANDLKPGRVRSALHQLNVALDRRDGSEEGRVLVATQIQALVETVSSAYRQHPLAEPIPMVEPAAPHTFPDTDQLLALNRGTLNTLRTSGNVSRRPTNELFSLIDELHAAGLIDSDAYSDVKAELPVALDMAPDAVFSAARRFSRTAVRATARGVADGSVETRALISTQIHSLLKTVSALHTRHHAKVAIPTVDSPEPSATPTQLGPNRATRKAQDLKLGTVATDGPTSNATEASEEGSPAKRWHQRWSVRILVAVVIAYLAMFLVASLLGWEDLEEGPSSSRQSQDVAQSAGKPAVSSTTTATTTAPATTSKPATTPAPSATRPRPTEAPRSRWEVAITNCGRSGTGLLEVTGVILNNTYEVQNYYIEIDFLQGALRVEWTNTLVPSVAPGQQVVWESLGYSTQPIERCVARVEEL